MNFPKEKESLRERLESWWSYTKTYKLEIPYRDFVRGIKNLKKWFKLAWNDADWDHRYIMEVLKFKIQNTADYIEKTQRHLDWNKDVKYMRIAVKLIDKLWPDEFSEERGYESEFMDYHETEFNFVKCTDEKYKGSYRMESKEISENYDEYFSKNKLMHKKAIAYLKVNKGWSEPKSKHTQGIILSKLRHDKAKKLLFHIISEHIESWWD